MEFELPVVAGEEGKPWNDREVDVVVNAYMSMLKMQESGQSFNKSECNRRIMKALPARNLFSISRKHSNISAVLTLLGVQTLVGYKPLYNFQKSLATNVKAKILSDLHFDALALSRVEGTVEPPIIEDLSKILVPPPVFIDTGIKTGKKFNDFTGVKRDYLAREERNRSIGLAGELTATDFERQRLASMNLHHLAKKVEHVASTKGDGLGFDILSFNADGTQRFIEVKTTSYGGHTPIFVSQNEIDRSLQDRENYWIYRIFQVRTKPRMFQISGDIPSNFELSPLNYAASLRGRAPLSQDQSA